MDCFAFTGPIWIWSTDRAPASWHFVTIDGDVGEALHAIALMRRMEQGHRRGWGAMKVEACIGTTKWATSIFPQKSEAAWLLPIKAAVRKAERLVAGDEATIALSV
ncbi:MAG: DUF1905 domain-containing protein [Sphingopyxis sp.]|nr:DUF1905 domain-containing protein [Sphingopyxis sp.]